MPEIGPNEIKDVAQQHHVKLDRAFGLRRGRNLLAHQVERRAVDVVGCGKVREMDIADDDQHGSLPPMENAASAAAGYSIRVAA
jgi:hypothetical protein